jgi:hypothetical protein
MIGNASLILVPCRITFAKTFHFYYVHKFCLTKTYYNFKIQQVDLNINGLIMLLHN